MEQTWHTSLQTEANEAEMKKKFKISDNVLTVHFAEKYLNLGY
jgi:hypothetical protein